MRIQLLYAAPTVDSRIEFEWDCGEPAIAYSVQAARDPEFEDTLRGFVLPATVQGCTLDLGPGPWFVRVGVWLGTAQKGVIDWSGIYGPIDVASPRPVVGSGPAPLAIHHVQASLNSVVFHTGIYAAVYVITDYVEGTAGGVPASRAKSVYLQDWGKGAVEVTGLLSGKQYTFRHTTFLEERGALPTNTIKQLGDGVFVRGRKSILVGAPKTAGEGAVMAAERVLLRDAAEKSSLRFSCYADYMQFLTAKKRHAERREAT